MANKAILTITAIIAGYTACRGIMETQESREITPKSAHVAEVDGIYPVREIYYDWEEGKEAIVSYLECDASGYARFARIPMPRCRQVSFYTPGICNDALEGICVDRKCKERSELSPEQIEAGFRKYEELCDILDCDGICEEWKGL